MQSANSQPQVFYRKRNQILQQINDKEWGERVEEEPVDKKKT